MATITPISNNDFNTLIQSTDTSEDQIKSLAEKTTAEIMKVLNYTSTPRMAEALYPKVVEIIKNSISSDKIEFNLFTKNALGIFEQITDSYVKFCVVNKRFEMTRTDHPPQVTLDVCLSLNSKREPSFEIKSKGVNTSDTPENLGSSLEGKQITSETNPQ